MRKRYIYEKSEMLLNYADTHCVYPYKCTALALCYCLSR